MKAVFHMLLTFSFVMCKASDNILLSTFLLEFAYICYCGMGYEDSPFNVVRVTTRFEMVTDELRMNLEFNVATFSSNEMI